jgi:hypothetical protein
LDFFFAGFCPLHLLSHFTKSSVDSGVTRMTAPIWNLPVETWQGAAKMAPAMITWRELSELGMPWLKGLWPDIRIMAAAGYQEYGRGAVVVDERTRVGYWWHTYYQPQAGLDPTNEMERLVWQKLQVYRPEQELVLVIIPPKKGQPWSMFTLAIDGHREEHEPEARVLQGATQNQ